MPARFAEARRYAELLGLRLEALTVGLPDPGLDVETKVLGGDPGEALVDAAEVVELFDAALPGIISG